MIVALNFIITLAILTAIFALFFGIVVALYIIEERWPGSSILLIFGVFIVSISYSFALDKPFFK